MSSIEINKIAGAVILAGLVALVSGILADRLVQPRDVEHAAVAVPEGEAGDEEAPGAPEEAPEEPVAVLLASADPAAGEDVAKRCAACHTFEQGGAAKVGPNLWDIVGAPPPIWKASLIRTRSPAWTATGTSTRWTLS